MWRCGIQYLFNSVSSCRPLFELWHLKSTVQDTHMNPYIFEEQYNTFHSKGYAHAPGGGGIVGKVDAQDNDDLVKR
jgi:hypothetical protein